MWRALFAFAVSDHMLSLEEKAILAHHMKEANLTQEQLSILKNDLTKPQSVENFFNRIQQRKYKSRFCELARTLVWCDGDISLQEKKILQRVSCFNTPANLEILKHSAKSRFLKEFLKKYEKIAHMNDNKPIHLFQDRA